MLLILILIFVPLVVGLFCVLWPRHAPWLPVLPCVGTLAVSLYLLRTGTPLELHLVDSHGVSLLFDSTGAWFMITNALVSLAVLWHERIKGGHRFFFMLLTLLHGCLNACFISGDLFNLYVVIELTTIIAFLMVGQGMQTRHLWNALRYLFLSNVGMLFFLLGTLLVYEATGGFALQNVGSASPTAWALIVTGLLVKGGVFLPGLWLPQAHAESETGVSALLSGVVVNIGLLPLLRLGAYAPEGQAMLRLLGMGGAGLGLALAFCQRDVKRLLACSTVSQVGFILVAPAAGAVYACAHGLAKACLFLCVGGLPDRDLLRVHERGVPRAFMWPVTLAALSVAGCPLFMGFSAKDGVFAALTGSDYAFMTVAAVGTASLMMRLVLLPRQSASPWNRSVWPPLLLLCLPLVVLGVTMGPYTISAWLKAGGILLGGWFLHGVGLKRLMRVTLPTGWERLEHVVGMTCLVLLILMVMGDRL